MGASDWLEHPVCARPPPLGATSDPHARSAAAAPDTDPHSVPHPPCPDQTMAALQLQHVWLDTLETKLRGCQMAPPLDWYAQTCAFPLESTSSGALQFTKQAAIPASGDFYVGAWIAWSGLTGEKPQAFSYAGGIAAVKGDRSETVLSFKAYATVYEGGRGYGNKLKWAELRSLVLDGWRLQATLVVLPLTPDLTDSSPRTACISGLRGYGTCTAAHGDLLNGPFTDCVEQAGDGRANKVPGLHLRLLDAYVKLVDKLEAERLYLEDWHEDEDSRGLGLVWK